MWEVLEPVLTVIGGLAGVVAIGGSAVQLYRYRRWKRGLTWDDALREAEKVLQQIEGDWQPDLVIGLGRSGGIWGGWLAGNLGSLPLAVVDVGYDKKKNGLDVKFPGGREVLSAVRKVAGDDLRVAVVEGAMTTGQTFRKFREQMSELLAGWDVKYAVLYQNPTAILATPDFVGREGPEPWPDKFPWHFRDVYRPYLRDTVRVFKMV